MLAAFILLCVAVMVLGVAAGKPHGWLALGLAVVSLLISVGATINVFR